MKVGIIGLGFVGGAVYNALQHHNISAVVHDPFKDIHADKESLYSCDGIFLCVPSPSGPNGECDTSILETVLADLKDYNGIIISKVTAPPNVYSRLGKIYSNLIHAPEFLVAATAKEDYLNGQFAIIGGNDAFRDKALEIVAATQTEIKKTIFCSIEEASLVKYTINSFLASKVVFMNYIKMYADCLGADFDKVIEGVKLDPRLGTSHFSVPGPDGKYGFGGACFPKDTEALSYMAKELGKDFDLLDTVIRVNKEIRNNK